MARRAPGQDFVSEAPRLGFIGGFDGVRGIGVVIVLLGHIFPEGTDSFNPIVDVFFVISAFLIVSLLMQERRQNGNIDLKRFYTRRALRLLPNSYACMAVWMLLYGIVKLSGVPLTAKGAAEQVNAIPGNVLGAATYVYHLVYPIGGTSGPLVQFWSLSLEEQFYLFVGLASVVVLAVKRRVWVACAVMAITYVWIGWSRWSVDLGPYPGHEYKLDAFRGFRLLWMARPDALLLGVLLAVGNARLPDPLSERAKRVIVWSGTIGAFVCVGVLVSSLELLHKHGFPFYVPGIPRETGQVINRGGEMWCSLTKGAVHEPCTDHPWVFRWGFTVMALGVAPLTLCMARVKDAPISRFLSLKWFRKVGEMSYSLYVWHLLAFLFVEIVLGSGSQAKLAIPKLLAAFGVSWLAHRYIDRAVLGMKLRFSSEAVVLDRRTGQEVAAKDFTDRKPGR